MTAEFGGHSMVAPLRRVLVRRPAWSPEEASGDEDWEATWGYRKPPDLKKAQREHDSFTRLLRMAGVEIVNMSETHPALYDSIFTYDSSLITNAGAVILRSGKAVRREEGALVERALHRQGIPVIHHMAAPASVDGGDMLWLDERTLLVGHSYRTNPAGIQDLRRVLASIGVNVLPAPVVHWHGAGEVMHLMSLLSPLDQDLFVGYPRLLAVETMELLAERGIELVGVPADEFETLAANVLAVSPRRCIMAEGNPCTRELLEGRGVSVMTYPGRELGLNMGGGPTCLTRPILREI